MMPGSQPSSQASKSRLRRCTVKTAGKEPMNTRNAEIWRKGYRNVNAVKWAMHGLTRWRNGAEKGWGKVELV